MTTGSHIWIYFIQSQATRLIKIGRSGNPAARIKSLQTGSPENLVLVGMIRVRRSQAELEEIGLHRRFVRLRHHNEWFLPGTELLDFIGNLPKSQDVAVEFTLVETTPIPATANDMTLGLGELPLCAEGQSLGQWIEFLGSRDFFCGGNESEVAAGKIAADRLDAIVGFLPKLHKAMLEERSDSIACDQRFWMIDRALLGLDHFGMTLRYITTGSYLEADEPMGTGNNR